MKEIDRLFPILSMAEYQAIHDEWGSAITPQLKHQRDLTLKQVVEWLTDLDAPEAHLGCEICPLFLAGKLEDLLQAETEVSDAQST